MIDQRKQNSKGDPPLDRPFGFDPIIAMPIVC
jgi:hypothetical protein